MFNKVVGHKRLSVARMPNDLLILEFTNLQTTINSLLSDHSWYKKKCGHLKEVVT